MNDGTKMLKMEQELADSKGKYERLEKRSKEKMAQYKTSNDVRKKRIEKLEKQVKDK